RDRTVRRRVRRVRSAPAASLRGRPGGTRPGPGMWARTAGPASALPDLVARAGPNLARRAGGRTGDVGPAARLARGGGRVVAAGRPGGLPVVVPGRLGPRRLAVPGGARGSDPRHPAAVGAVVRGAVAGRRSRRARTAGGRGGRAAGADLGYR